MRRARGSHTLHVSIPSAQPGRERRATCGLRVTVMQHACTPGIEARIKTLLTRREYVKFGANPKQSIVFQTQLKNTSILKRI
jgi:hypothetical protein